MRRTVLLVLLGLLVACGDSAPGPGDDLDTGGDAVVADTGTPRDTGRDPVRDLGLDDTTPSDGGDANDSDTAPDSVEDAGNQPPVAVAGADVAGEPGRPLHFDGTGSHDDGTIVAWSWAMGNGVTLTGAEVDYTYPAAGVYTVTLTVTDDDGLTGTDTLVVDLVEANEGPVARIDGPHEAVMGEETTWDGRTSEDDIGIASWTWTTGVDDEGPHDGQVLDYTYQEWEGRPYRLTLVVTDTDGEESVAFRDIVVLAPPVAQVAGPSAAFVGDEVTFDATESYDPDDDSAGALESVQWNFGDGTETDPSPWFPIHTMPTHVFTAAGRFDVVARVQDSDGIWRDSATHKIDVYERPNLPPTPQISAASFTAAECAPVTLDGRLSLDDTDDAADLTYFWDFGDGDTGSGIETTHAYDRAGAYTVTLTALDIDRAAGETTRVVTVTNVAPTADFAVPPEAVDAGEPVNFDGTDSADHCEGPGEDRIVGYQWTWGDGVMSTWSDSPIATHTWTVGGVFDVTLTVRDDGDPALTNARTRRITVRQNQAPTATLIAGNTSVDECESVSFSGSLSSDDHDAAADLAYAWDFGDGTFGAGMDVEHRWDREGVYLVRLTVVDSDDAVDEESVEVTVANVRPTASFEITPNPGNVDVAVSFDASGSSDHCEGPGEDRVTGYQWAWGDGTMSTWSASPAASHTYTAEGPYDVTLTVRDDGDPQLTHATSKRLTIQPPDVGPIIEEYGFTPAIANTCAFELVSFSFSEFELTLDDTTATVRVFSGDPGTMTGSRPTADTFDVTAFQSGDGACDETYTMEGTINGDGTITFDFVANYVGPYCFDCTRQTWSGRIASPLP